MFDSTVILRGEIWSQSLLGVKRLNKDWDKLQQKSASYCIGLNIF